MENGELIDSLPTDDNPISQDEKYIVDTFFKEQTSNLKKLLDGMKDLIVLMILYCVVSLPQTDEYLERFFPSTRESIYMKIGIRAFILSCVYFLIKNLYLVRK